MGRPFKIQGEGQPRGTDGRFQPVSPPAQDVIKHAQSGASMNEVLDKARVSDHATPKGQPQAPAEMPSLPVGSSTDANKKPFRVG